MEDDKFLNVMFYVFCKLYKIEARLIGLEGNFGI